MVTADSVSPRFDDICYALEDEDLDVSVYEVEQFVDSLILPKDLKRFSRYWNSVQRMVMRRK